MTRIKNTKAAAGFTIIESLVSMALVSFMVASLGTVMTYAARNTNLSRRITRANALADEAIEKSRNTAYQSLRLANANLVESCTISGNVATCTSYPDNGRFTRVRTVSPRNNSFPPGLTTLELSNKSDIDVTVTFTDFRGNPQVIRVASIVSRH